MTKAELAKELHEKYLIWLPRKEVYSIVELFFDTLKEILAEGEIVKISGFGTFIVRKRGVRKGRNLKTGEEVQIEPRKVVTFKPSLKFKEMVENV